MQSLSISRSSSIGRGDAGIRLTASAAQHLNKLVQQTPGTAGVRLQLIAGGNSDDQVYERDGARVFVSPNALLYVNGTKMDYVRDGINQVFRFHNPNVRNECGCGESFGI